MNPCIAMDYIENCLKIKTKSGTVVPFRLNDAQRKLYAVAKRQQDAGKPVRLIILKARQLGFSTLTEGLIFHACATRKNVNALIVAHREDATANLFRMSKLFYDELPAPVKPMLRASNAQELVFENPSKLRSEREARPGLRSRIRCATAGGRGIGRSDTLQCVHLSEYAFWPDGADGKASTLAGILQAVPSLPGTMVVIESTANGFEDFKERWDAAVAGENDFEPVFFAWFENPDYSMPVVPGTEWTPEERDLKAAYQLTDEQLQWRRWCIANNCGGSLDMFRQEYPASPGEAFLHSGTGVFDNEQIVLRLERLPGPAGRGEFTDGEWTESETGAITLYELPEEGVPYETYYDYYFATKEMHADKDENGKSISGSKKAKVVEYINSLDIPPEQKDALYVAAGYTAKSARNQKWNGGSGGSGGRRGRGKRTALKAPTPKAPEIIIPKSGTASSAKAGGTSKTPKVSGNVIADFTKTASGTDIQKAVTQAKRKALKAGNRTVYVEEGSPIDYFLKYGKLPSLK